MPHLTTPRRVARDSIQTDLNGIKWENNGLKENSLGTAAVGTDRAALDRISSETSVCLYNDKNHDEQDLVAQCSRWLIAFSLESG